MDQKTLLELSYEYDQAGMIYRMCGMTNVFGKTPEERAQIDLQYQLARRRFAEAQSAYMDALDAVSSIAASTPATLRPLLDPQNK